jgi:multidrug efflux pump subunit AcrA (membrane-fusion protein)
VIALIVIFLGLNIYSSVKASKELLAGNVQTYSLEKKDLTETVSAVGRVVSLDENTITADVSGVKVTAVNVKTGDYVKEGDVIFTLDSEEIEKDLADAENNLNVTRENARINEIMAERSLNLAKIDLDKTKERTAEQVDQATREYDIAKDHQLQASILDATENNYYTYIENIKEGKDTLDISSKMQLIESADQSAEAAESTLEKAKQTRDDSVLSADVAYADRANNLTMTRNNNSIADDSAEKAVRQYEDQLESCTVVAPVSGLVTSVNLEVGDTYTGQQSVVIEDDSVYKIKTSIEEYDINKIAVGQRVEFKTYSNEEEIRKGKVESIAPRADIQGTGSQTTVSYEVIISMDEKYPDIRMDMTAKISIIPDEVNDVFAVPYDAVLTDEDGNAYIEVRDEVNGEIREDDMFKIPRKKIFVTKGAESGYYTEIGSEQLTEGMEVILPSNGLGTNLEELLMQSGAMGGM